MPTLDNARHEQFAQLIVAGEKQNDAYAIAYGNDSAGAQVNASKLIRKDLVANRIAELRATITERLPVLTLEKKRKYLLEAVETPIGQIDENSPLCQSYKKRTTTNTRTGEVTEEKEFKMPSKLEAIELDARLAGELNSGGAQTVRISMYDQRQALDVQVIDVGAEAVPRDT